MRQRRAWWWAAGSLAAIGLGWTAAKLHASGVAPVGLLPLAIGAVLGLALAALAPRLDVGRRHAITAAIVLAVVTVLTEHAWLYREFRRQWHEARAASAEVALFRPVAPWSPREYFRRELAPARLLLWTVDAVLIVVAAVGVVIYWHRASATDSALPPTLTG